MGYHGSLFIYFLNFDDNCIYIALNTDDVFREPKQFRETKILQER